MLSFETAVRLKDAGFPQPAPQFGQLWYDEDQDVIAVVGAGDPWDDDAHGVFQLVWSVAKSSADGVFETNNVEMAKWAYCPTDSDLLKALGQKYVLWFDESPKVSQWFCAETGNLPSEAGRPFGGKSPAEACAEAWLAMKARQFDKVEKLETDED